MFFFKKDLAALGQYIEQIIRQDSRVQDNFNEAARLAGISSAELFALRKGTRQKPNPEILYKLAQAFNGDYDYMLQLAGHALVKPLGDEKTTNKPQSRIEATLRSANDLSPEAQAEIEETLMFMIEQRRKAEKNKRP